MNVRELIEELSRFDPDMEVGFGYVYPDYWRSTLVKPVNHIEPTSVYHSDYHGCDAVASEDSDEVYKEVLTLSSMRLM